MCSSGSNRAGLKPHKYVRLWQFERLKSNYLCASNLLTVLMNSNALDVLASGAGIVSSRGELHACILSMLHVHPSVRYVQKAETCDVCLFPCLSVSSPPSLWLAPGSPPSVAADVRVCLCCLSLFANTHTQRQKHTHTHIAAAFCCCYSCRCRCKTHFGKMQSYVICMQS